MVGVAVSEVSFFGQVDHNPFFPLSWQCLFLPDLAGEAVQHTGRSFNVCLYGLCWYSVQPGCFPIPQCHDGLLDLRFCGLFAADG